MSDIYFVLTGGPGSGKTSLARALAADGFRTAPEAGRAIIQAQAAIQGPGLPATDPLLFAELMLSWDMRSHHEMQAVTAPVIFDRGIPDSLGYLALSGVDEPPHMRRAAELYRYNRRVFALPPWPEIYANDVDRRQSIAEAERTFENVARAYVSLGYELIEVPKTDIARRVDFLKTAIERTRGQEAVNLVYGRRKLD